MLSRFSKHIQYSFRNALGFIKRTYRKEGFLALYRGNTATLARIIPYSAVQFASFEHYRKLFNCDNSNDPRLRRFVAGALAGVTSQSVTYPLDLARARMAVTNKFEYRNIWEVFTSIYTKEGPRSLYRGYVATIIGVIPYAGTSFFTYETLKAKYYCKFIHLVTWIDYDYLIDISFSLYWRKEAKCNVFIDVWCNCWHM